MLKPKRMCKVTIAGPKSMMEPAINALYDMGLLHIEDYMRDQEGFDIGTPLEKAGKISEVVVKMRSLQSRLSGFRSKKMPTEGGKETQAVCEKITEVEKKINELDDEVSEKTDTLKEWDEDYKRLEETEKTLSVISCLPLKLDVYTTYDHLKLFVGYINRGFEKNIKEITDKYELYQDGVKKRLLIALIVDISDSREIREMLDSYDYEEIDVSSVFTLEGDVHTALEKVRNDKADLKKKMDKMRCDVEELKGKWSSYLDINERKLSSEAKKAEAPLKFATTKNTFVVRGWMPEDCYEKMNDKMARVTEGKIHVEKREIRPWEIEKVPIALGNPKVVRPFEFFMNMYALPKYGELDPTFFMFLVFPLFYGFMLGDIGYGIVTLALFLLLRWKLKETGRALLNVLIFSSIVTVIFGVFFGEFFGEEEIMGMELHPYIHRALETDEMLMITIIVGLIHVNIGYFVGFYNELKMYGLKDAVLKKGSWLIIEVGAALFALNYLNYISISTIAAGAVLLAGIGMLLAGEGAAGIIELPSLLSHILSYSRLMAVGLASVYLAMITNEYAGLFFHNGGFYIIAAVGILVVGHGLNIALGVLGPFLQSMRLHYVEFFTKFYEGGGDEYSPFGEDSRK